MRTRLSLPLLIAVLGLVFFGELVLHPTQMLYDPRSDLVALHLPRQRFLAHAWRETGEVPLWCPYASGGIYFVHDVQNGLFYPPHLLFRALPEGRLGAGLSWLTVAHVVLAGWLMYLYARSQDLGRPASLVAALGYMFAGKCLVHLLAGGHYNTVGLAWLPLALLWLEQAIRRGSLVRATWAGAAFALLILGTHPQWTFYAGLFTALWTLGPALEGAGYLGGEGPRSGRRTTLGLARWLGCGAVALGVAAALAAEQLLPAFEANAQTDRVVGRPSGFHDGSYRSVRFVVTAVLALFGPPLTEDPVTFTRWSLELRGGWGLPWAALAVLAPLLGRGRVRFQALVCLLLILVGLGGGQLLHGLPGFRLFRLPSRIFLIAALPVALLAGSATQALLTPGGGGPGLGRRAGRILFLAALVALTLTLPWRIHLAGPSFHWHPYWATLLVTAPAFLWLLGRRGEALPGWWPAAWVAVLLADLWGVAWPPSQVRPEEELYRPSACVRYLLEVGARGGGSLQGGGQGRVLDQELGAKASPLGRQLPLVLGVESLGGYNPLDITRFKQYLGFVANEDQPVRSLVSIPDFPIENKRLLDLLGVRYLVVPSAPAARVVEGQPGWHKVFEDPEPMGDSQLGGGTIRLPAFSVYENREVLPRAFVVPQAAPLPGPPHVREALARTDFRRQVLLEDFAPTPSAAPTAAAGRPSTATVREYRPNRGVVGVDGGAPGYLVLADVWFPGWHCCVDGEPARLYRANFLFRAVAVPAGEHEVVFTFAPASYARGWVVSAWAAAAVALLSLWAGLSALRGRLAFNERYDSEIGRCST